MAQCTAPVEGHRTASGRANCPACRGGGYYSGYSSYYSPPTYRPPYRPAGVGSSGGGGGGGGGSRRLRTGTRVSYTAAEWRRFEPVAAKAERIARAHPDRRDLFLCHAWPDREGPAKELCDLLLTHGATVWFSEYDVGLGKSLLTEIDKGLRSSRIGIVLVTPAMLEKLDSADGIASKELAALLATDRVIPVAYNADFDDLREVSPLLGARSGLTVGDGLTLDDAARKVAAVAAAEDCD